MNKRPAINIVVVHRYSAAGDGALIHVFASTCVLVEIVAKRFHIMYDDGNLKYEIKIVKNQDSAYGEFWSWNEL